MAIYDVDGQAIGATGDVSSEEIRRAFIGAIADGTINMGSQIGATLSYSSLSDAWITNAQAAYNAMLAEYKTKPNVSIPFFISTDQHGSGLQQHRFVNNIDKDGMNVISINLGDTVQDVYGENTIQGFWDTIKQVKNYIGVVGNHEAKHSVDRMYESTFSKVFSTTNLQRRSPKSKCDCYVVDDPVHAVKWLVLEDYYINADGTGYTHGFDAATVDWIIEELSKNDGLDVIILMHWPCWRTFAKRGMTAEVNDGDSALGFTNRWSNDTYLLWDFFVARKRKQSGTYNDINGVAHSFDFSNCESDLLCTLHGHTHAEWFTTEYGLTGYAADRYYPAGTNQGKCVFGLVDRLNQSLKILEFNATEVTELLTLEI